MKLFAKPFLVSAALGAAALVPAHAQMDVARLQVATETSVEADYPKLDALYKDIHAQLFAPVPKPAIETGIKAMTLAVLSAFDQHARGK